MAEKLDNRLKENKKDTGKFANEIMDFTTLRRMLRNICMYGAFSVGDYIESGLFSQSERSIYDYLKRIDNYLNLPDSDNLPFKSHNLPGRKTDKKSRRIVYDCYRHDNGFLSAVYHEHSIVPEDLIFYFYFLLLFSDSEPDLSVSVSDSIIEEAEEKYQISSLLPSLISPTDSFTVNDIISEINSLYECNSILIDVMEKKVHESKPCPLSDEQIRNRLNDFSEIGFLTKEAKVGQKGEHYHEYRLSFDIFSSDNNVTPQKSRDTLLSLLNMIEFFSMYMPLSLPGYLLERKIRSKLDFIENRDDTKSNTLVSRPFQPFGIINSYSPQNILDDDVVSSLSEAIIKREFITYTYSYDLMENEEKKDYKLIPVKIISEASWGRHYLLGFSFSDESNLKKGYLVQSRIDHMYNVTLHPFNDEKKKIADEIVSYVSNEYEAKKDSIWNVSLINKAPISISLLFSFDTSSFGCYEEKRFLLEMKLKNLKVECNKPHAYEVSLSCSDFNETIPWLCGYGHFVSLKMESTDKDFYDYFTKYKKDILSIYESV